MQMILMDGTSQDVDINELLMVEVVHLVLPSGAVSGKHFVEQKNVQEECADGGKSADVVTNLKLAGGIAPAARCGCWTFTGFDNIDEPLNRTRSREDARK